VPVPEADEKPPLKGVVSSNRKEKRKELKYSKKDVEAVEEWVKRHVETTWHCLGVRPFIPLHSPPLFMKTGKGED
jgi:alcohol oxidase